MTALGPFTIDMYLPALPDIADDLGASSSTVQLTITGTLIGMAALFAYVSGASFVYQDQHGLDQQEFALLFSAGAIALIGASQVNVRLLDRWTPQQIPSGHSLRRLCQASFSSWSPRLT